MVQLENKRIVGKKYEDMAAGYISELGYKILERNYRIKSGEIDIIAKDGDYIVFAEVKYRKNNNYGTPFEAVDYRKQNRIRHVALAYIYKEGLPESTPIRFDIIGIIDENITLIKNAF